MNMKLREGRGMAQRKRLLVQHMSASISCPRALPGDSLAAPQTAMEMAWWLTERFCWFSVQGSCWMNGVAATAGSVATVMTPDSGSVLEMT